MPGHSLSLDLAWWWDNCINPRYSDSLQEDVHKMTKWNKVDHFGLLGLITLGPSQTCNCRFPVFVLTSSDLRKCWLWNKDDHNGVLGTAFPTLNTWPVSSHDYKTCHHNGVRCERPTDDLTSGLCWHYLTVWECKKRPGVNRQALRHWVFSLVV